DLGIEAGEELGVEVELSGTVVVVVVPPEVADGQHRSGTAGAGGSAPMEHPRGPDQKAAGLEQEPFGGGSPRELQQLGLLPVLDVVRDPGPPKHLGAPEMAAVGPDLEGPVALRVAAERDVDDGRQGFSSAARAKLAVGCLDRRSPEAGVAGDELAA